MNKSQFNWIEMLNAVIHYLEEHRPIWEGITIVSDIVAELQGRTRLIMDKVHRQAASISEVTFENDGVRLKLERTIHQMASQLAVLADRTLDDELAALCEFTLSTLDIMHRDALEAIGERIHGLLIEHLVALADDNISAEDAAEFQALLEKYRHVKAAPRRAIIAHARETTTLPDSIRGASQLLRHQLDKLMNRFQVSHPEFLAGYLSARARGVIRRGARTVKPTSGPAPEPKAAASK